MKYIWNGLSIRYKIISIIVITILLVTVTILPAVSYVVRGALLKQQQNHLESVKNLVTKLFDDYQSKVTNYTKLFSNDREIKDSLFYHTELSGEREHPLRAITRLFKSFDVSTIEIGDIRGRVVAVAEAPDRYNDDRSPDPLIKSALQGKVMSGIVLTKQGFIIKASAPIFYNENQTIGTITSGILLDDSLLSKIKLMSNTDLVIVDSSGSVISSTMKTQGSTALTDGKTLSEKDLSGKLLIKFQLADMSNAALGTIMIIQEDRLPGIISKTHLTLLILLLTISAGSVFVLFLVLNRVLRPVVNLREGAERIGKGEFGHRIEVISKDEIGELSVGFNRMAANLEKMRSMEERLYQSERLAAIGKFAAGIAHEINNPIGNVIGIAKLRLRNTEDPAVREDLESIIKDSGRCASIIKDLLVYSRQSPPKKELTALDALIDRAIKTVMNQANSKRIEIVRELAPELPDIPVDSLQMSQVLNNILLNSVQSIESSGRITIRTSLIGDTSPTLLPQGEGTRERLAEISITDDGVGIADEIKDKIFYPFFTTKAVGEGTGLGLAISYGIVQNHGGEIIAESGKEHGSTFRIRLPMGEQAMFF
ncbi:MAG: HAMP domain-containing protein [Nitrospirae bacterium]|nr:HAMP domain-containing protein [Nitrospirota bacterium]